MATHEDVQIRLNLEGRLEEKLKPQCEEWIKPAPPGALSCTKFLLCLELTLDAGETAFTPGNAFGVNCCRPLEKPSKRITN